MPRKRSALLKQLTQEQVKQANTHRNHMRTLLEGQLELMRKAEKRELLKECCGGSDDDSFGETWGSYTSYGAFDRGAGTDSALTEKGKSQMRFLAAKLAKDFARHRIRTRILASDLRRAKDSAQIIAEVLSEQVEVMPFLREKNNGQAAGLDERTARTLYVSPFFTKRD